MNCIIRGVRVIDPVGQLDAVGQDVWISDGRIIAIYKHIGEGTLPVIDLTPPPGGVPCILCPGFIDLHTHVRQPDVDDNGNEREDSPETVESIARAAAAGGFTHIITMANTQPAIDSPQRVSAQAFRAVGASIEILTAAALTRDLAGKELVDIAGCAHAGAVAFSDDGRNGASAELVKEALRQAAAVRRPVLIHPEDELTIAPGKTAPPDITRAWPRPSVAESHAVGQAIRAASEASVGQLHLQHLSTAASVDLVRLAKQDDIGISAEVTPHHLGMWLPFAQTPSPASLVKVNPPLRSERDRVAVIQALREGVIDAIATDHAPHRPTDKTDDYEGSAPGMVGLETALSVCLTYGGMDGDWIPVLIERLTAGPYRVLGDAAGVQQPRLRIGEAATCVVFDPAHEWVVGQGLWQSHAHNTPLMGQTLRGRVMLTLVDGHVAYKDSDLLAQRSVGPLARV